MLPSVRIVRPESEATIVPRAKRFGISFAENSSGLPSVRIVRETASRLKASHFNQQAVKAAKALRADWTCNTRLHHRPANDAGISAVLKIPVGKS